MPELAQQASATWLTLCLLLILTNVSTADSEIYLRKLSIHQIHRVPQIEGAPSIFFQCTDEEAIHLTKVQAKDQDYLWNEHDLAVVSVAARSCKACAFYEHRTFPLRKDNIYGSLFQLCEVDFAETGSASKSAADQFDAVFTCDECKSMPSPSPALPPVLPPSSDEDHREAEHSRLVTGIAIASIFGGALMLGVTVTAIVFVVRDRRRAQANASFEAAMQDSGLGLDEAFEQDAEAFHQSLLHPSAWYKLKDGPSPDL